MYQLATIFEKIKENFFSNLDLNENKEAYKLIFAPFSSGFTNDDFLFLDTNNASENAHKYLDELYEFSQITNTIPTSDNFWTTSNNQNDYLFNKYKTILNSLRLIDPESLHIEVLYEHPIFNKILNNIVIQNKEKYLSFYKLYKEISEEIKLLKNDNTSTSQLQINLKESNLETIKKEWLASGNKEQVETLILKFVKDEIKRFILKFSENKSSFNTSIRTHLGSGTNFYLTYCMPNNLHEVNKLKWKKISINKKEINTILNKENIKSYSSIFSNDTTDLDIDNISFELLFVNVTRSWFDQNLLESPFWNINILNRSEIDIPRVTTKLILIRKINLNLQQNSTKNQNLFKTDSFKNFGPFIANPKLLLSKQKIQLHSVNTALSLERKTVMNVASKLRHKNSATKNKRKNLISKKQQQFIKLAPRLQKNTDTLFKIQSSNILKNIRLKNTHSTINLTKYEFNFIDNQTKRKVTILPDHLSLFKNNRLVNCQFQKSDNGSLQIQLLTNTSYKLSIHKKGYETKDFLFTTNKFLKDKKEVSHSISLIKNIKSATSEKEDATFQLIGVVSKNIIPFPTPISGVDYI